jgi:hypothetical protein
MEQRPNQSSDVQVAEALGKLREIQETFSTTPTRDLPFCTAVSHVHDYEHDLPHLRRYGDQVITARCYHFAMLSAIKAYWNIQMYFDGVNSGNALALPAAARAQIELFALLWHVNDVVSTNAGLAGPDLAKRMLIVDEALIMALYGTRSEDLTGLYQQIDLSRLRPNTDRDMEVFKAKNILTRIQKTHSGSDYKTCLQDYDRLSELLHPNSPQNLIFLMASPQGENWFRLGLRDPQHVRRAQYQSAHAMVNSSWEILRLSSSFPEPFANP